MLVRPGRRRVPAALAGVVPLGLDGVAGEPVQVDADGMPGREIGDDETAVRGPGSLNVVFAFALAPGNHGLVGYQLVPGTQLEQPAHIPHLAGAFVGDRLAPWEEAVARE